MKKTILIFAAAIIFIVLIHLATIFSRQSSDGGSAESPGGLYVGYNPFPNLPQVRVSSSSGAVTSTKTDYKSSEEPTIKVDLNKL